MLIATHSVKALNIKFKQSAIRSQIDQDIPNLLSSRLLKTTYFASPKNAADIASARDLADQTNADQLNIDEIGRILPDIEDGKIKQVLVPYFDDYVAITPIPSLAVIAKLHQAKFVYDPHVLQPTPAALSNHGDPIARQNGRVKLIRNNLDGLSKDIFTSSLDRKFLLITARCENMNISSCYVSCGMPALTSIGGFVHVLERETKLNLDFGFGIKNIDGFRHAKRGTNYQKKGAVNRTHSINLVTDEITATAEIAIVLRVTQEASVRIIQALKKINRLAGGSLFDVNAEYTDDLQNYFWYAQDSDPHIFNDFDKIFDMQKAGYKFIHSGYALLEQPMPRRYARADLHSWAEPIFSLIKIKRSPSFFNLKNHGHYLNWE